MLEILDKKSAVEEIEYSDEEHGKYLVRVELDSMMASINTEVKTIRGEPLYVVRWAPRVTWRKLEQ